MASIVKCDSCGEVIRPRISYPDAHVITMTGHRMNRTYDLCDVCRPTFLRMIRRMAGSETEGSNVNLRTHSVTFATKTRAQVITMDDKVTA